MRKRETSHLFKDLVELMAKLRGPDGCPWDKEQDHFSIKPYLVEEAYEVLEAIDEEDPEKLKEELGDLLLQVIFHSQMASEKGWFDILDVLSCLIEKLTGRHPHVFSDQKVKDADEVLINWEKIKQKEKKRHLLSGVPKHLPALLLARRIQDKLSRAGHKLEEEELEDKINLFRKALKEDEKENIEEALADLLFLMTNICRLKGIDAEDALRRKGLAIIGKKNNPIEDVFLKEARSISCLHLQLHQDQQLSSCRS